jgi:hypothetical protein
VPEPFPEKNPVPARGEEITDRPSGSLRAHSFASAFFPLFPEERLFIA